MRYRQACFDLTSEAKINCKRAMRIYYELYLYLRAILYMKRVSASHFTGRTKY